MDQKSIPHQLHNDQFGFVKLIAKTKKPFEKNWPNIPYSLADIHEWFNKGNNYGILGGQGDLIVVDADSPEMVAYARENLPRTFTVGNSQRWAKNNKGGVVKGITIG